MLFHIEYQLPQKPKDVSENYEANWGLVRTSPSFNSDSPKLLATFYGDALCDAALDYMRKVSPSATFERVRL